MDCARVKRLLWMAAAIALFQSLQFAQLAHAAVPGPPTHVVAIPGNGHATVGFDPPASDGGSPITSFTVTSSPGGVAASGLALPIVVPGLANGTRYSFTVTAANASGSGPSSAASNTVTPIASSVTAAVAADESFTLALDTAGQVYAWGSDGNGQLGQGRQVVQTTPVQVQGLPAIQSLSLYEHALAVDASGRVWSWGESCFGELGPRATPITTRPSLVLGLEGVAKAAAGYCNSYVLKGDGTVWQLNSTGTEQVAFPPGIVDIQNGGNHLLALRNDGTVWGYGLNSQGNLGIGSTAEVSSPVQVPGLSNVTKITTGGPVSAALSNGIIYVWGTFQGPAQTVLHASPTLLSGLGGTAIDISASGFEIAAVRSDGTVWYFTTGPGSAPTQVQGISGVTGVTYGANGGRTIFTIGNGTLAAWGSNASGQLGQGSTTDLNVPFLVPGFIGATRQVQIGFFDAAVLALKNDGTVWFWGANSSGQRGDGNLIGSSVPLAVPIPATITKIAAGFRFGLALDTSGRVWGWGANSHNLDDTYTMHSVPAPIPGISNVVAIAGGGFDFTAFATADGNAWTSLGGIRQITGVSNVVAVAAGLNAIYFLRGDGAVFASGFNGYGEFGNGTTTEQTGAVRVTLPVAAVKIAASGSRVAALAGDGRVFVWGADSGGSSLTGGTNLPVAVTGVSDAIDIAVSWDGVLVRRSNGGVLAWGYTGLSDAPTPFATTPYPVALPQPIKGIALGREVGYFIGDTGLLWGWGLSTNGLTEISASVGDGAYVTRSRPVVISAAGGLGTLDSNNWYLDLEPDSPESVPPSDVPTALATAKRYGAGSGLGLEAAIRYKAADLGKNVNTYVVGVVPPSFLASVKTAPGTPDLKSLALRAAKGGGFVLVQLTPAGWTDAAGQLIAFTNGVATSSAAAQSILSGFDTSTIPGARFCIGYGESGASMLTDAALREVLRIEGTSATVSSVPCVLSGLYLDGPSSSVLGAQVTFDASAVGLSPTGSVQFKDQQQNMGTPVALTLQNPAVSRASMTTALSAGVHSIGAHYAGDSQNPPADVGTPLAHTVSLASASLPGPLSGLFWNSGESGWGINFTQRGADIFGAWYTYDAVGNPKWYVVPNCTGVSTGASAGTCSGPVYEVNGPRFFGVTFTPITANQVSVAGNLQVAFSDASNASMTFTVAGVSRTVAITRQIFPIAPTAPPPVNYTDLWWSPAEAGWGMSITHQYNNILLLWYVYDGNGRPMWYVASNCTVTGSSCSGTLYRTTGPAFGAAFDTHQIRVFTVGSATVNFTDPNNAVLNYIVDGVSGAKTMTRELF
ncbi:MAG TPA: Ig-like domain repeat protein [Usitatibacter sp.]|nr:Ig-like domain repeat protein [Usitatibacter sp.]